MSFNKFSGSTVAAQSSEGSLKDVIQFTSAREFLLLEDNGKPILYESFLNPLTSGLSWDPVSDQQAAYKKIICTSQMTSMLRDFDRNNKYDKAIRHAIKKASKALRDCPEKEIRVLDIGTGTGLLAMMAARTQTPGADISVHVDACEMFEPLASLAVRIIKNNGFHHNISVFPVKSTELALEPSSKAHIIVTELFDTALLGEGVISALQDAYDRLLLEDHHKLPPVNVVPQSASVFVRLVTHPLFKKIIPNPADMNSIPIGGLQMPLSLSKTNQIRFCHASRQILPFHIKELLNSGMQYLSDPIKAMDLQFKTRPESTAQKTHHITLYQNKYSTDGAVALLFYWDLYLNESKSIIYSTAPDASLNWQDHWLQGIYPLENSVQDLANTTDRIYLHSYHDETSFSFELKSTADAIESSPQNICECGHHEVAGYQRMWMLSDTKRLEKFVKALKKIIKKKMKQSIKKCTVLDTSDGSLCAIISKLVGATRAVSIEEKPRSLGLFTEIGKNNSLDDTYEVIPYSICLIGEAALGEKVDVLCSEPFYYAMEDSHVLAALNFWLQRSVANHLLEENATIMPKRALIKGRLVNFQDLWKAHGLVRKKAGELDHDILDEMQDGWYIHPFSYPLWMYKHKYMSDSQTLFEMDYTMPMKAGQSEHVNLSLNETGLVHAVIVWVEYELMDDILLSTGCGCCASNNTAEISSCHPVPYTQEVYWLNPKLWDQENGVELDEMQSISAEINLVEHTKVELNFKFESLSRAPKKLRETI